MPGPIAVELVDPHVTYQLRRDALRPTQTVEEMAAFDEDGSGTAVFGAIDLSTGELVGTASVRREPAPLGLTDSIASSLSTAHWRLRAMATRDEHRGQGVGSMVLGACVSHVARQEGRVLWCNARLTARRFYERGGLTGCGEEFDIAGIAHIVMWRIVEAEETGA
ncbi:MAG: GNAT family N-acetyltransferase [Acidimicrobiales bacterium]